MAETSPKPLEAYQGHDWLTYRWPVAQLFDTLDRIRDLCHRTPGGSAALPQLLALPMAHYDMPETDHLDLFHCILELCDDMSGEIDAVLADLLPLLQKDAAHRWMGFEMRLHLREIRNTALMEHKLRNASGNATDTILALASRIRSLLRLMDQ